ncbi:MAG: ABC transporter ATP-binding protein [Candidatus Pacebacteria bacterium]|nr:ABC transporter ATP-binding protein [Candidatus Paceibacterota bacterium]
MKVDMPIIETKKLLKNFDGVKAVDDLSIQIEKGKITGIIGPNGSGKTTLINLLTGILPIDAGAILIDGIKTRKIRPQQISFYGITRTFQTIRLFEQMTVLDNILIVMTKRNIFSALFEKHKKYHLKKAEDILTRVELWDKRNQLAVNLSYGQRKLLEIARALATRSQIFLLDEPFAGLFPEMRKIVASIIRELREEEKTIILIEHNIDLIRELCDYIIALDSGQLLAEGLPVEVLENEKVVEAYLGK